MFPESVNIENTNNKDTGFFMIPPLNDLLNYTKKDCKVKDYEIKRGLRILRVLRPSVVS
jgi:hypothetical protein